MKLRIKDPVELFCAKCRKKIIVNLEEVRYEADICDNRSMGPEIQHTLWYNGDCPFCKLVYYFSIDAFEYPEGLINFVDYDTNGASWWKNNKPILLDENGNEVEYDT